MKNNKGFTLIELLVVISIIALLMSIMMPGLSRARNQAKRITCAARLHNIGLALDMYTSDHDYKYPTAIHEFNDRARTKMSGVGWLTNVPFEVADPIRKEYQIETLFCPANSLRRKRDMKLKEYYLEWLFPASGSGPPATFAAAHHGAVMSDYCWLMTFHVGWRDESQWSRIPFSPSPSDKFKYQEGINKGIDIFIDKSTVRNPSTYPLVVDAVMTMDGDEVPRKEDKDYTNLEQAAAGYSFFSNHLDGATAAGGNELFCDGSVRWVRLRDMYNYGGGIYSFAINYYW